MIKSVCARCGCEIKQKSIIWKLKFYTCAEEVLSFIRKPAEKRDRSPDLATAPMPYSAVYQDDGEKKYRIWLTSNGGN